MHTEEPIQQKRDILPISSARSLFLKDAIYTISLSLSSSKKEILEGNLRRKPGIQTLYIPVLPAHTIWSRKKKVDNSAFLDCINSLLSTLDERIKLDNTSSNIINSLPFLVKLGEEEIQRKLDLLERADH